MIEYCVYTHFIPMNATVKTFLLAILWIVRLSINTSIDTVLKDTVRGPLHVEQSSKLSFTLWVCVISLCGLVEHEAIKARQIEIDGHVEALNGFIWAVTHIPFHQGIYRVWQESFRSGPRHPHVRVRGKSKEMEEMDTTRTEASLCPRKKAVSFWTVTGG